MNLHSEWRMEFRRQRLFSHSDRKGTKICQIFRRKEKRIHHERRHEFPHRNSLIAPLTELHLNREEQIDSLVPPRFRSNSIFGDAWCAIIRLSPSVPSANDSDTKSLCVWDYSHEKLCRLNNIISSIFRRRMEEEGELL